MGLRWLINAVLLVLPVGATVGVLLGIDLHRHASGQEPLFNGGNGGSSGGNGGGSSGGGSSGGGSYHDNGITNSTYCQKQVGIAPPSKGEQYTLNPNQWGWTEGTAGNMCMNVTAFHNQTYATNTTAPKFSVTWQYPQGPESQPVHAFPNAQISSSLPAELQSLQHLKLDLEWTYGVGNEAAAVTDEAALTTNNVNTNVAVDMFIDSDKAKAQNSSLAGFEVMVWFAAFGTAAQPIGLKSGIIATHTLNATTFNLYTGQNSLEQNVLTWVAAATTGTFSGDISPLLTDLTSAGKTNYPTTSMYLGHIGIGSEAFSADVNVTFSMPTLSIDLEA